MMERCLPDWRVVWRGETLASSFRRFDNWAEASSCGVSRRCAILCARACQMRWSVDGQVFASALIFIIVINT